MSAGSAGQNVPVTRAVVDNLITMTDSTTAEETAARRRRSSAVLVLLALTSVLLTACSGLTPSTGPDRGPVTDGDAGSGDGQALSPQEMTTTTADLPDPLWQDLDLVLTPIAQLAEPIAFARRSGSLNYYVAERAGRVVVIERSISDRGRETNSVARQPLLDLTSEISTGNERGLLGIEFSSDGRTFYASYTDLAGTLVLEQFPVDRRDQADLDRRRQLLRVDQPAGNHNGGSLALGSDGFLYLGIGDGGGSGDPGGHGQNTETLLGSVVRIDPVPDGDQPYRIPGGNPFVSGGGRPEIWLWGVRNPWRLSFDSATGDLWIADVGQNEVEEINRLAADDGGGRAANLGWNEMEGDRPFEDGRPPSDHVPPVYTYDHEEGRCAVTGGYVYRGDLMAPLRGVYVFADYCSGEIFGLVLEPEGALVRPLTVRTAPGVLASFGEGPDGELLVLERTGPDGLGIVYRIEPEVVGTRPGQ
jgi:glucose/arabinose dehydrogenase